MSASWGDRMWDVNSVESFVVGVKMRSDSQLTFRLKRMVPLTAFTGMVKQGITPLAACSDVASSQVDGRQQRLMVPRQEKKERLPFTSAAAASDNERKGAESSVGEVVGEGGRSPGDSLLSRLEKIDTPAELSRFWQQYKATYYSGRTGTSGGEKRRRDPEMTFTSLSANRFMTRALNFEQPDLAVDLFETVFGFQAAGTNPAAAALRLFKPGSEDESDENWAAVALTALTTRRDDAEPSRSVGSG